ncbi:MAG: DUF1573 domain-containing protein [Bernardetiaceae bacterium]|jgi:hypothetical protein|nr:DUF1573 domain-containing protein [Bernardetiaceae bacterium]
MPIANYLRTGAVVLTAALLGYNGYLYWSRPAGPVPVALQLSPAKIDFKKVELGKPVTGEFTVTNPSTTETIVIDTVDAGCTCTQAQIDQKIIAPGGRATIKVWYRNDITGLFVRRLTIRHNGTNNPTFATIEGKTLAVTADTAVNPR